MKDPNRFPIVKSVALACVVAVAVAGASLASVAHAAPRKGAKSAEPARPAGETVAYEDLEQRVGQEIEVETSFHTKRRGTLIKYTQPTLTLELGPESGSIELTVPRDTIRSITVIGPGNPNAGAAGENKD